ncbi:MAG: hypothetical protein OQJ81_02495 [Melioribacteraceae bacterium]|nr:hypothetical protein [Melioribacteraceae bacterium]
MKKLIIILSTLLTLSISAQSLIITQSDQQIIFNLFNGNWEKSDSLLELKYSEDSNSLKYNFLKAYNSFYTRYLGNNNPYTRDETIRQVKKYSWEAIQIGEELNENLENNFYLGSAYALLARVNVMEQDLWDAYWNASKSENYFDEVIEENQNIADAYLNLGIFEYFPAVTVTGFNSVLAWLGGMSGDREEGISKIEKVAQNGNLYKEEANFALALLYGNRENDLTSAYEYWKSLHEKFSGNNGFLQQTNRTFVAKLIDEKGVDFLNTEFDDLDSVYNISDPTMLNLMGYSLLNQERFDEAKVVFEVNIKKYPEVANGYDSFAEYFMMIGDNDNAIKYYKQAFEKLKTDTTITDQFRERLEEGIKNNLNELESKIDV